MSYKLYDIFTKTTIDIADGEVMKRCRELGIDNTALAKIGKEILASQSRYICEKDKDKIFTLVEFETGKEYDCINNNSLFAQLEVKQSEISSNETKYIYELKKGRQTFGSICGKVFHLKGADLNAVRNKPLKVKTPKHLEMLKKDKIRYRISARVIQRIRSALIYRLKKSKKSDRSFALLGCSISFYMGYLESKFTTGMTWILFGEGRIHIDHIIPTSSFNLELEEEQRKAFHYTNTQPLWAEENMRKGDKMPEDWKNYKKEKQIMEDYSSFCFSI